MRQIRRHLIVALVLCALVEGYHRVALATHTSDVDPPTNQVSRGVRQMGQGITETARGVGNTVAEGTRLAGEKVRQTGEAIAPPAKNAWEQARDGVITFGRKVGTFFDRLF